jgi:hypothetical protein
VVSYQAQDGARFIDQFTIDHHTKFYHFFIYQRQRYLPLFKWHSSALPQSPQMIKFREMANRQKKAVMRWACM